MSFGDDIGTILFPDFDQEVVEDEFRIIRQSVKNLHKQNQSKDDLKFNKS
jgi:hypothetical protein